MEASKSTLEYKSNIYMDNIQYKLNFTTIDIDLSTIIIIKRIKSHQ